jgi:hypothetical protein
MIFNIVRDVCLGVKYDFIGEVSVVSKEDRVIRCLLIVRCRLNQNRVTSVFVMLTPIDE